MEDSGSDRMTEVLRLHFVEGLSVRAICRRLRMARKTVRRLVGRSRSAPVASPRARTSLLDPYEPTIRSMLAETPELRAPAILERLRAMGFGGGITIVRERVATLRERPTREAFLTLDFAPGSAAQIDWADFGWALPGCPRRVSAFVMVLCHSRYLYLEFALSQSMGTFLRCMERALKFFGGTTYADIFDNMKTVVLSHTAATTVFNPTFVEYARVRGFAIKACNVRKAHEKGRVERPIGFVRTRFFPGRRFHDLADLNAQALHWRDTFANAREHEVTGKVPALVYEHVERAALRPVGAVPFDTDDLLSTGVTKMFRVTFDRNRYSVPWHLVGQSALVRADDAQVAIALGPKIVACHRRSWSIGEDIEDPLHARGLLDRKPRASAGQLPEQLTALGEVGTKYFRLLGAGRRSIHRETIQLAMLVELFGGDATRSAIAEVLTSGHVGCDYVEYVLRHRRGLSPTHTPLRLGHKALDDITLPEPDLSGYDQRASRTLDPGPANSSGTS